MTNEIRRLRPECITCVCKRYLENCPEDISEDLKVEYMQRFLTIIANAKKEVAVPVLVQDINALRAELFGFSDDYEKVKAYFNQVMLEKEDSIRLKIQEAEDSLKAAMQFAMIGNYIDFGAMQSVDEEKLGSMLDSAREEKLDEQTYLLFKEQLQHAKRLVYLTDNCGEIVLDKLLIEQIKKSYPDIQITVMVRGKNVLNDATLVDAKQVGMDKLATVVGNGSGIAGTWYPDISTEAKEVFDSADVLISKGQANFETMQKCGKNIFYLFLCKCHIFEKMFQLPRYSGIFTHEKYLERLCNDTK